MRANTRSWVDDAPGGEMSHVRGLSSWSWSFILLVAVMAVALLARQPSDALLLPGFFVAPLLVLYLSYWRHLRHDIPLDLVIKTFAFGFGPGALVVMVIETILAGIFFLFCFHEQIPGWYEAITARVEASKGLHLGGTGESNSLFPGGSGGGMLGPVVNMPGVVQNSPQLEAIDQDGGPLETLQAQFGVLVVRTPGLYIFLLLMSYVIAAGTEESLKYCVPLRFRACRHSPSPHIYLVTALAAALGFATIENIGYTYGSAGDNELATLAARAGTAYSRAVVAIAAHGLCGAIVGVGLTRKHVLGERLGWTRVLLPSVAIHGTFDAQQMLLLLLVRDESAQTAAALFLNALVLSAAAIYLCRMLRCLHLDRWRTESRDLASMTADAEAGADSVEMCARSGEPGVQQLVSSETSDAERHLPVAHVSVARPCEGC